MTTLVIAPGEYRVSDKPSTVLKTLLGSCVAVCLYDRQVHVFGMNHFLLAVDRYQQQSAISGRYGIQAMELLLNSMYRRRVEKKRLQAKVFGGANVLGDIRGGHFNVGQANVEFAFAFLQQEDIPVVAHDVGGDYGRNILFDGRDMSVYVRMIDGQSQTQSLAAAERQWYDCQRQEQQREEKKRVIFWDD